MLKLVENYKDYILYDKFKYSKYRDINKEEAIDKASFLSFLLLPTSNESKAFLFDLLTSLKGTSNQGKKGLAGFENALNLTIPMLLAAYGEEDGGYVYRSMATSRFKADLPWNLTASGIPVGYRWFKRMMDALAEQGFIEVVRGYIEPKDLGSLKGQATRFKASDKLISFAADYGIMPEFWHLHFTPAPRPMKVSEPIILKAKSSKEWHKGKRGEKGTTKKERGMSLPVDYNLPQVAAYAQGVNWLNGYMAKQDIQPAHLHHSFYRVFSEGDGDGADFSKGGRIYSHGVGKGYQNVKKAIRRRMTIGGAAIAEVDLRASYLTILHQRMGYPLPKHDPYTMPDVPRHIAKMWVSATLGNGKLLTKWPDELIEKYRKDSDDGQGDLQAEYPMGKTGRAIRNNLPILEEWAKNPIKWGDLQFIESTAVMDAIVTLAREHDIPALPLHDALIVQESMAEIAAECLWESFRKIVGIAPYITISTHQWASMRLAA